MPEELLEIFEGFCKDNGYALVETSRAGLLQELQRVHEARGETFGNARDIRNWFERAMVRQANRLSQQRAVTDEDLVVLTLEDVKP